MNDPTTWRNIARDVLQAAHERRVHAEAQRAAAVRAADDAYVHRAGHRRDDVRRHRLAENLAQDLGGRRPANTGAHRAAVIAARQHLAELGLASEVTDKVARQQWWASA